MKLDEEAMLSALGEGFYQKYRGASTGDVLRAAITAYLKVLQERECAHYAREERNTMTTITTHDSKDGDYDAL